MTFSDDVHTAQEEVSGEIEQVRSNRTAPRDPLAAPESEEFLRRAADLIASARPVPLSASVMIHKDDVLDLLGEAIDRLPDELKAARWLLKEREAFLAKAQAEGQEITDAARNRAEAMVQRTEVVKAAELRARRLVEAAEAESRRLHHECEDFCDQKLASFEIVLDRTTKMVQAGREKLAGPSLAAPEGRTDAAPEEEHGFFDQDEA